MTRARWPCSTAAVQHGHRAARPAFRSPQLTVALSLLAGSLFSSNTHSPTRERPPRRSVLAVCDCAGQQRDSTASACSCLFWSPQLTVALSLLAGSLFSRDTESPTRDRPPRRSVLAVCDCAGQQRDSTASACSCLFWSPQLTVALSLLAGSLFSRNTQSPTRERPPRRQATRDTESPTREGPPSQPGEPRNQRRIERKP